LAGFSSASCATQAVSDTTAIAPSVMACPRSGSTRATPGRCSIANPFKQPAADKSFNTFSRSRSMRGSIKWVKLIFFQRKATEMSCVAAPIQRFSSMRQSRM
jgi:hypothetical protein